MRNSPHINPFFLRYPLRLRRVVCSDLALKVANEATFLASTVSLVSGTNTAASNKTQSSFFIFLNNI
ncbi:MAG: hypothetical protein EAZ80_01210 [Runella slithyformis]|nr:MAG: hypothetical protein EAZ80_01210 [Runella slithyformis]